ncbi:hypothetical protein ANRL1_04323 [Anaerolineae bacterium]|nr:hypothetical protein ANRL1_04323 [Anaerolineae bacterium]
MYQYVAFGLGIHSDIALGETETRTNADVVIRVASPAAFPDSLPDGTAFAQARSAQIQYRAVGVFTIRDGTTIELVPVPGADELQIRLTILGPVFSILLHQRGGLVLHASAVAKDCSGIAILGAPGWGKSTTAAALVQRGYALVADDIIAVRFDYPRQPIIYPAFPFLKIGSEVARALGEDVRTASHIAPAIDKYVQPVARADALSAIPLRRVYVLASGEQVEIESLTPQDGFFELVRHTFVVHLLDATGATATHFEQCAQLANTVPIKRLKHPQSLASLAQIVEQVERDAR